MNPSSPLTALRFQADLIAELGRLLPLQHDTEEARAFMLQAAMDQLAGLAPANTAELWLAVQAVVIDAHGADFLRRAGQPDISPKEAERYRRSGRAMKRTALETMRTLSSAQAHRRKREPDDPANATSAAIVRMMMEAAVPPSRKPGKPPA